MWDKERLAIIKREKKKWEEGPLRKALEKTPERYFSSDFPKKILYTPDDLSEFDYLRDLGFPGMFPYTRGIHPSMYRSRLWSMAEYSGFGRPEDTNKRWKFLLSQGQTGVSLAPDLPTQLGYDPDEPLAEAEVGVVGVSCPSLKEVELLFEGIPLDKITIRGSINHPHAVLWAMYMAVAEKQGVPESKLGGTVHWDCLNEYLGRGTYIFPPEGALHLALDFLEYAIVHIPRLSYMINAYTIRESGADLVQEGAYAIAAGITYLKAAEERGIKVDKFAPRLSFNHAVHMNIFEEVSKFRALRRLWAKIIKERFGAAKESSMHYRFGPGTGGSTFTVQEPENNIARAAYESLAAILGGATYLHTASYDEAYAIPTEQSVRIALKTQLILAYESGVTETVDPLAGSYYIESLTDEIENKIRKYLEKIENHGGLLETIKTGWFQKQIAESAYKKTKEIEEGRRVIIGVNRFVSKDKPRFKLHKADPDVSEEMKRRVKKLRKERDNNRVNEALSELRNAMEKKKNVVPYIKEAVKSYATLGEICGVLKEGLGKYDDTAIEI